MRSLCAFALRVRAMGATNDRFALISLAWMLRVGVAKLRRMRMDLFLKQTGLIKRRPVAKAMCDAGKIERNGKPVGAGDEVRRNDILRINYGFKTTEVEVLEVPSSSVRKNERTEFYHVIKEERDEDEIRSRIARSDEPMF